MNLCIFLAVVLMTLVAILSAVPTNETYTTISPKYDQGTPHPSRRILAGRMVGDTRPYMVYLRAAAGADQKIADTNWSCGGVIIEARYVLTSAACIEDAKHFYVVSGTHKWVPADDKDNECVNNGQKKAVWKCVPKAYYFDGDDFDNIRWMVGDIAVVKVEDDFNFERRIRGCDFIPKKVFFNNRTDEMEKSGTQASMAGWGSTDQFGDVISRPVVNSADLLEADAVLMSKKGCKKRWDPRYHFVIEDHMICSKDITDEATMNAACAEQVNCKELVYSEESDEDARRRMVLEPSNLVVHTAAHIDTRRAIRGGHRVASGGFCENDHGGPLIVGQGKSSVVVGVMSACLAKEITHKCYGPFLYTSVYKYRDLISCAIDKDNGPTCRRLLRSSKTPMFETIFDWSDHPDGPVRSQKHMITKSSNISPRTLKPPLIPRAQLGNTTQPKVLGLQAFFP